MNLKTVQDKIEGKGYTVGLREEGDFKWLQCFLQVENLENKFISFGITINDENLVFWDASLQKPKEVIFQNEKALLEYIEEYFNLR